MTTELSIYALVLKVAERCNLNCTYCYMYNHVDKSYQSRPKFMEPQIFDKVLEAAREYSQRRNGRQISLTFHGGEPMLVGPARFNMMLERAHKVMGSSLGRISIQTNAILADQRWAALFRDWNILVGVSLDGPKEVHDRWRVRRDGGGSHDHTVRGIRAFQDAGVEVGILCVIDPSADGLDIYNYFLSLGLRSMDFLLPDVTHDTRETFFPGAYGRRNLSRYLISVFDSWISRDDPEIRIRIFWNFLRHFLGSTPETDAFGNLGMSYLVIESDGQIEALDALKVCAPGISSTGLNVIKDDFEALSRAPHALKEAISGTVPLSAKCTVCSERKICGGGYLPHRFSAARGFDNPSAWCEDIFEVLAHMRKKLDLLTQ
jgi:uncharacterized protein